jgi:anti-sigma factor RsiW
MTDKIPAQPLPSPVSRLTCEQVTELIIDYLSGELEPTTRQTFEAHLRGCKDCAAFLQTYRETIRATQSLRYEDIPHEMQSRVQQFLQEKMQRYPPANSSE